MVSIVVSVVHRPQVAGVSSTVSVSVHTTHNGRSVVLHLGMAADIRAKFLVPLLFVAGQKTSHCIMVRQPGRRRLFSCLAAIKTCDGNIPCSFQIWHQSESRHWCGAELTGLAYNCQ